MGLTMKENGVLKLVHPGGLVEIHTSPITADEVMKMNPKHCVARPDVFKNPWIVVRPESVLKPGSIFYIVPHHTMRKLMLKAQEKEGKALMIKPSKKVEIIADKGSRGKSIIGSSRGAKQSRVASYDQSTIEYSSVDLSYFNSLKDMTPSHAADKNENLKSDTESCGSKVSDVLSSSDLRKSEESTVSRKVKNKQALATTPNNRVTPRNGDEEESIFQRRESKEIACPKDPYQLEREPEQLPILEKPVNNEILDQELNKNANTVHISEKSQRVTGLKSCLKPRNTTITTSNLRVRFMLPGDEEKIMRTRLWLSQINPETP